MSRIRSKDTSIELALRGALWRAGLRYRKHYKKVPGTPDAAAGLAPGRVRAAESGVGVLVLDDLEKIARVLGVKVVELFLSPGRTAAERVILALLEGEGCM